MQEQTNVHSKKKEQTNVLMSSHMKKRLQLKNKKINRKLKLNFDCIMDFL